MGSELIKMHLSVSTVHATGRAVLGTTSLFGAWSVFEADALTFLSIVLSPTFIPAHGTLLHNGIGVCGGFRLSFLGCQTRGRWLAQFVYSCQNIVGAPFSLWVGFSQVKRPLWPKPLMDLSSMALILRPCDGNQFSFLILLRFDPVPGLYVSYLTWPRFPSR